MRGSRGTHLTERMPGVCGTIGPMTRVVHLHIGAPKTGTTYLQDRLMRNVDSLAEHGVTVPSQNRIVDIDRFHFRAALDLLDQDWGGAPGHAKGAWNTMLKRIRSGSDHVIVSHEILSGATSDKVARLMNDLAGCEVHIVYSARDLGRQLPAAYQESIKQGRRWPYRRFLRRTRNGESFFFRNALDLPTVLNTWSAKLPPERVHVVTVPHDRGPRGDELWQRFCRAFAIDPAWAPKDSERRNQSLGVPEIQVLRSLNQLLDDEVPSQVGYQHVVREFLAEKVLVERGSAQLRLPPEFMEHAENEAQVWIDWLHGSGVDVVGDPEDLRPRRYDPELYVSPDGGRPRAQLAAALAAMTALTEGAIEERNNDSLGRRVRTTAERLRSR